MPPGSKSWSTAASSLILRNCDASATGGRADADADANVDADDSNARTNRTPTGRTVMSNAYSPLLEPGRICSLERRNQIIVAPMGSNFAESDGKCGERIRAYYDAHAQAAVFDGIELHAGHTYLVAGFLSAYTNQRDDGRGGSPGNRARVMVDMIRAAKGSVGAGLPVCVRPDGEVLRSKGGVTLPDAVGGARLAVEAGTDAVSMSACAGFTSGFAFTDAPTLHQPGFPVGYSTEAHEAVNVPVIAAGRISPKLAAESIAAGHFDFVAMARKLAQGRACDIRPCNCCDARISGIFLNSRIECPVKAELGDEAQAALEPAAISRHVRVIGSGPPPWTRRAPPRRLAAASPCSNRPTSPGASSRSRCAGASRTMGAAACSARRRCARSAPATSSGPAPMATNNAPAPTR